MAYLELCTLRFFYDVTMWRSTVVPVYGHALKNGRECPLIPFTMIESIIIIKTCTFLISSCPRSVNRKTEANDFAFDEIEAREEKKKKKEKI